MSSNDGEMASSPQANASENPNPKNLLSLFGKRTAANIKTRSIAERIKTSKENYRKARSEVSTTELEETMRDVSSEENGEQACDNDPNDEVLRPLPARDPPGMKNGLPLFRPPRQRRRGILRPSNRPAPRVDRLNNQNFHNRATRETNNRQKRFRKPQHCGRRNCRGYREPRPQINNYYITYNDPILYGPTNHSSGRFDQLAPYQQPVSLIPPHLFGMMNNFPPSHYPPFPFKPANFRSNNHGLTLNDVRNITSLRSQFPNHSTPVPELIVIDDDSHSSRSSAASRASQGQSVQPCAVNSLSEEIQCIDLTEDD
uniref:Uncharacterized protein n=1 Tax=Panagrolaimus sp. JU765 TaxID=591449 RepID=A0AC34RJ76_9BILA